MFLNVNNNFPPTNFDQRVCLLTFCLRRYSVDYKLSRGKEHPHISIFCICFISALETL